MAHYPTGITLKALLENPDLINPPKLNDGDQKQKKGGDLPTSFPGQSAFLGLNIWDKSGNTKDDDDFNFEYMDFEEFLSENGIPMNDSLFGTDSSPSKMEEPPLLSLSPPPAQGNCSPPVQGAFPSHPFLTSAGLGPGGLSPGALSPGALSPGALSPGALSPLPPQSPETQHPHSSASPNRSADLPLVSGMLRGLGEDQSVGSPPAALMRSDSMDSQPEGRPIGVPADYSVQEQDLLLANTPGQYERTGKLEFDPRCRSFKDEELRPQPMIKKSRKVFVNDDMKDDKYWSRRKKNNVAAKRSRDARRIKENQITLRAAFLEKQNSQLIADLEQALTENKALKAKVAKYEN